MRPWPPPGHPAGGLLGEEVRPLQVGRDQLVEALFGGLQQVAALARPHAGIVHQKVEVLEALAGKAQKRGAVLGGGHVAGEDFAAGFAA